MEKKTFLEVMAGPGSGDLRLTQSQKRVLRKILDTGNPKIAAEALANAPDSQNLIEAAKILARYGYITTVPEELGEHTEPQEIELTDKGQEAADEYNIQGDNTLITPEEKAESEPNAPEQEMGGIEVSGPEGEFGGEGKTPEEQFGFESFSFVKEINDLTKILG